MTEPPKRSSVLDSLLDQLFELPKWDEKPGTEAFDNRYLKLLTELSVLVNERKTQPNARPKVFVARYPDSTHFESDSAVDVIFAYVGYGKEDATNITRETLSPLPEAEFHQFICDVLAPSVQQGSIKPVDINNILGNK